MDDLNRFNAYVCDNGDIGYKSAEDGLLTFAEKSIALQAEVDRLKEKLAAVESRWVKVLQIIESERRWLQLVAPPKEGISHE